MFIELYDKYRVNVINIASYYPYDETRIMIITFTKKEWDKLSNKEKQYLEKTIDNEGNLLEII